MDLKVEKIIKCKNKKEIKEIYVSSFPEKERMPFILMLGMSCLWNTEFLSFYDGDTLCGLVYMATIGKQTFIMFFAVNKNIRSNGYGSSILDKIQLLHPDNKIIVSIEPCNKCAENLEQRLRRKEFYVRNGYEETGYYMKLAGQEQEILIKNGTFHRRMFTCFFMLYSCCTTIPKLWIPDS